MTQPAKMCPTCGQAIDPLRAPTARITGGRIVTYCSKECAAGAPAPRPATPAPVPAASRPTAEDADHDVRTPTGLVSAERREERRRPSKKVLIGGAVLGISALGIVIAIVQSVAPSRPTPAEASTARTEATPEAPAEPPPPAKPDPEALRARALDTLRKLLGDTSPRIRLHAARALARVSDENAVRELLAALENDSSTIRRLEVAYALARAGRAEGVDFLVQTAQVGGRNERLEAARSLARLGDERAVLRLHQALNVRTMRLGAAEALALLGDERGLEALKDALEDDSEEIRLRAAVALGQAGDPSGMELLRTQISESRVEVGAASALAALGDRASLPALERALGLTALRVEAAVAIRRFDAEVDLTVLEKALAVTDEYSRITAAEAILVLTAEEPPAELIPRPAAGEGG